jgi:hypothetical protein
MPDESDRALQDALIRLLADAPFRRSLDEGRSAQAIAGTAESHGASLPESHLTSLRALDPARVERFARFLARHYYLERVSHFHHHLRTLARYTGVAPEHALSGDAFRDLMPTLTLGSRDSARAVGAIVGEVFREVQDPPYVPDLVRYGNAQMIVEAGPRVWRSDAAAPAVSSDARLTMDSGTVVERFDWNIPALLPSLRAVERGSTAPSTPPVAARESVTLLFARSPRGRVTVLQWNPSLDAFAKRLDGTLSLAAAADAVELPLNVAIEIAEAMIETGAARVGGI